MRLRPDDDVISWAKSRSPAEVGSSIPFQPTDAIDFPLLQHDHLGPGAHHSIAKHDVARLEDVHQRAKHPKFALTLAGVATNTKVNHRSAGEREDGGQPRHGE